jgi:sec-independent protein translocase protein TatB
MFDSIGFPELLLIGIVALLVVGPKDLPLLMRKAGRWVKKMRGMADDFRANFDDLARQAELDELRKEVEALKSMRPLAEIEETLSKPLAPGLDATGRIDLTTGEALPASGSSPPGYGPVPSDSPPRDPAGNVLIDPPAEAPAKPAAKASAKASATARKASGSTASAAAAETVDPARRALVERAGEAIPRAASRKPRTPKTPLVEEMG